MEWNLSEYVHVRAFCVEFLRAFFDLEGTRGIKRSHRRNYVGHEERLLTKKPSILNHWGRPTPSLADIEKIKSEQSDTLELPDQNILVFGF